MIYLILYLVVGLLLGAWYLAWRARRTSPLSTSDLMSASTLALVWPAFVLWFVADSA